MLTLMLQRLGVLLVAGTLLACSQHAAPAQPVPVAPTEPPPPPPDRDEARRSPPPDRIALVATVLVEPARLLARRQRFARAVVAISTQLGQPIALVTALADMPCGGWSGPGCSNLTIGLEAAKVAMPLIVRMDDEADAATLLDLLVEAVSIHSVWHDAYGYVWNELGLGQGYIYAGCSLSRCEPGNPLSGQVEGILYQMGRLVGLVQTPECGSSCTLPPV
jgi:hypothetical protein